jgi:hypothetical protein
MINDHINCDCLECAPYAGNHADAKDTIIGKFVKSNKPINIYKTMGGSIKKIIKPGDFVGKVESINAKKTWIKLPDYSGGGYVYITKDLRYNTPNPNVPALTADEKIDIVKGVAKNYPGGEIAVKAGEIVKGAAEATEGVLNTITFVGKNLKWFLIGIVILIVVMAYLKYKKG